MGESPWLGRRNGVTSPEGTTRNAVRRHVAPSGLAVAGVDSFHGLAPVATTFRPFGTGDPSDERHKSSLMFSRVNPKVVKGQANPGRPPIFSCYSESSTGLVPFFNRLISHVLIATTGPQAEEATLVK